MKGSLSLEYPNRIIQRAKQHNPLMVSVQFVWILTAGLVLLGHCACDVRRENKPPSALIEFSSITNSITPDELLRWADAVFTNSHKKTRFIPESDWPRSLIGNVTMKPKYIGVSRDQNGNVDTLLIDYGGGFQSKGIAISKNAAENSTSKASDRHIHWTNRVTLYYSP